MGRWTDRIEKIWAGLVCLLALAFTLFPLYWVASIALKNQNDAFAIPPKWFFNPVFENFVRLWQEANFFRTFANSVIITICGVVIAVLVALPLAYAMLRLKLWGKGLLNAWLVVVYMLPEFLLVIPMFAIFQTMKLYDTHLGLMLIYQVHALPLSVWLMTSFFAGISKSIDEAVLIDGGSFWRVLFGVYLPCSLPGVVATMVLNAIWIWNELAIALGLTYTEAETVTVGVTRFRGYASLDWGAMSAASVVAIVPMLLFATLAQKHLVRGVTLGAVKE